MKPSKFLMAAIPLAVYAHSARAEFWQPPLAPIEPSASFRPAPTTGKMKIPVRLEQLNRWYRSRFAVPAASGPSVDPSLAPFSLDKAKNPFGFSPEALGSEVNNGGNEIENRYRVRGFYLVEQMRHHNRRYVGHPRHQIPEAFVEAIEKSVRTTNVYAWEEKPRWNGMPRNAGIFPDPADPSRWAIAIHRPVFEQWVAEGANFDENVLHEYALAAGLRDDYYAITAPFFARIASTPLSQTIAVKEVKPGDPKSTAYYFRGDGYCPKVLTVELTERQSGRLWNALHRPQLVADVEDGYFQLRESPAVDWSVYGEDQRGLVLPDAQGEPLVGVQCYSQPTARREDRKAQCNVWYWNVRPSGTTAGNRVELAHRTVTAWIAGGWEARTISATLNGVVVVDYDPALQAEKSRATFSTKDEILTVHCDQRGSNEKREDSCRVSTRLDPSRLTLVQDDNGHVFLLELERQRRSLEVGRKFRTAVAELLVGAAAPPLQLMESLQPYLATYRLSLAARSE